MAQNSLGRMYDLGWGLRLFNPYTEANKWYLLAANQGDAEAMFNIGKNYGFGRGVTKDLVQAFMLAGHSTILHAAQSGHENKMDDPARPG